MYRPPEGGFLGCVVKETLYEYAVYIGRFSPIHFGHMKIIDIMIKLYGEKSMMMIGSSNSPLGDRLPFTYLERRGFIKKLYPKLALTGIPDFSHIDTDPTFETWHTHLWDTINFRFPDATRENTVFYGGSEKDIKFFIDADYKVCIVDRNDLLVISGTKVRYELEKYVDSEDIGKLHIMLDPLVIDDVKRAYAKNHK